MRRLLVCLGVAGCSSPAAAPTIENPAPSGALAPPCAPELAAVGAHDVRLPRAMAELVGTETSVELVSLGATFFQEELSMIWMAVVEPAREFPGDYASWIESSTGHAPSHDEDDPLLTKWFARWSEDGATREVAVATLGDMARPVTITYQCWGPFPRPLTLADLAAFPEDLSPAWMPGELRDALDDRELAQVGVTAQGTWEYALGMVADEAWIERWRSVLEADHAGLEIDQRQLGHGLHITITRDDRATPPE